jgi:NADH:ubiquinone oxidoreductase subunit
MEKVYKDYPKDQEAAAFYALSLLVSEPPDDKSLANSRKAIEILNHLLEAEPQHPGAAHYLIHAADNPNFAVLGLPAARTYAQIAPEVPHALHIPSHIFARLGLWQEDIQSNLASLAAARRPSGMHIGAENQVHAMEFLEYAYLQTGEPGKAREMIEQLQGVREQDLNPGLEGYLDWQHAQFPARYALELREWKKPWPSNLRQPIRWCGRGRFGRAQLALDTCAEPRRRATRSHSSTPWWKRHKKEPVRTAPKAWKPIAMRLTPG